METFNFSAPADVFAFSGRASFRGHMTFRKFATGAEAIRYVMETMSAEALGSAIVETEKGRLDNRAIRSIYDSAEYPLTRKVMPLV